MISITVSQEVLDRIWALKRPGERTEDAILARVLASVADDDEGRLKAYEEADQDIQSTN